jgi:VWFA-related protein
MSSTLSSPRVHAILLAAALAIASQPPGVAAVARQQPPPIAPAASAKAAAPIASETRIEVVAVDKDGKPVEGLRPADLTVTIDGAARPIVSIRRVSRGPGALSDAARRQTGGGQGQSYAAEPIRNVVIVIDQETIVRGEERTAIQAAAAFFDRLSLGDRVAVVRLPAFGELHINLATERQAARSALTQVRGQTVRTRAASSSPFLTPQRRPAAADEDTKDKDTKDKDAPPQQTAIAAFALGAGPPKESELNTATMLTALLRAMQPHAGRKVVAVFSPGFRATSARQLAVAAEAAIAARATVYTFGLPIVQDDPQAQPDPATLRTLANRTGGAFVPLGKSPEKAIDRVMDALSAVYVLSMPANPGDLDGQRRTVRVQSGRAGLTLRAPAWLLPAADPPDTIPEPAAAPVPPAAARRASSARPAENAGRQADLPVALGRLVDYVRQYEAQYSALVAEEEYVQNDRSRTVTARLRSDVLLLKQEDSGEWVSFRDVFEVDGRPVRDRDDRLRKLFLEPGPDATAQLLRIKEESARHNIGPLRRNINVPLYLFKFLSPAARPRLRFMIGARQESGGLRTWRVDFTEVVWPTIIHGINEEDLPASGHFLLEQSTGAIVETLLHLQTGAFVADIRVRFRIDPGLGLWVQASVCGSRPR